MLTLATIYFQLIDSKNIWRQFQNLLPNATLITKQKLTLKKINVKYGDLGCVEVYNIRVRFYCHRRKQQTVDDKIYKMLCK